MGHPASLPSVDHPPWYHPSQSHSYMSDHNKQCCILPRAPSSYTLQYRRRISYQGAQGHHTLLRTRQGNRNLGTKDSSPKDRSWCQYFKLQSFQTKGLDISIKTQSITAKKNFSTRARNAAILGPKCSATKLKLKKKTLKQSL